MPSLVGALALRARISLSCRDVLVDLSGLLFGLNLLLLCWRILVNVNLRAAAAIYCIANHATQCATDNAAEEGFAG